MPAAPCLSLALACAPSRTALRRTGARWAWGGVLAAVLTACGGGDSPGPTVNPLALDTAYGQNGEVRTALDAPNDGLGAAAVQADGKLLLAGWRQTAALPPCNYGGIGARTLFVRRLNADGSMDTRFGKDGNQDFQVLGGDTVTDMQVQTDGRIVLAVQASEPCVVTILNLRAPCTNAQDTSARTAGALVRLAPDGRPDPRFGEAGTALGPAPSGNGTLALAVQPDQKPLLLRSNSLPRAQIFGWLLNRYLPDGQPDPDFNQGQPVPPQCRADGQALALLPNGRIVAGGGPSVFYADPLVHPGICLEAYLPNGQPDPSYRPQAPWSQQGLNASLKSLHALPDGRLLAGLQLCATADCQLALARFDAQGLPDPDFGTRGEVRFPAQTPTPFLVGVLPSRTGGAVLRSWQRMDDGTTAAPARYQAQWLRVNAQGEPDTPLSPTESPRPQRPLRLLQDPQGRWITIDQAVRNDGTPELVVTRRQGESR
ncbi:MAG: hypothetical protein PHI55_08790 [Burkholderiaceae bacterium]|nr:hypothetical protein [Burkholderiaceae bacterium]